MCVNMLLIQKGQGLLRVIRSLRPLFRCRPIGRFSSKIEIFSFFAFFPVSLFYLFYENCVSRCECRKN